MNAFGLNQPLAAPRYVWLVLAIAFALMVVRGFAQSASRQALLVPQPIAATLSEHDERVVHRSHGSYVILRRPSNTGRVALHQAFPERTILRWLEPAGADSANLAVPLAGLSPGRYVFARATDDDRAVPREMDEAQTALDVVAAFELVE